MKTHIAVILWVLGVFVAMLGSTALDAWFKRQEQAKQYESIINDILANTCPNPACGPSCCGDKCKCGPDCECNLVEEVEEQLGPKDQAVAPTPKIRVWLHSIDNCPPCVTEKARAHVWANQKDCDYAIFDDTPGVPGKLYPWYEVRDADGFEFSVLGQLTPETLLQHRDRAKNATRARR